MLEKLMTLTDANLKHDYEDSEPGSQTFDTMCLDKYKGVNKMS